MSTNYNPIRRTPIRHKPREPKRSAPWRARTIRLDQKGMCALRGEAYSRAAGVCECNTPECLAQPTRLRRVNWFDGQLHHVVSRARGGSDTLENVIFITRACHRRLTGELKWTQKPQDSTRSATNRSSPN